MISHNSFQLRDVLHAPKLSSNLIYVQHFCLDNDVFLKFHSNCFMSRTSKRRQSCIMDCWIKVYSNSLGILLLVCIMLMVRFSWLCLLYGMILNKVLIVSSSQLLRDDKNVVYTVLLWPSLIDYRFSLSM